jgi:hypothetical protein
VAPGNIREGQKVRGDVLQDFALIERADLFQLIGRLGQLIGRLARSIASRKQRSLNLAHRLF